MAIWADATFVWNPGDGSTASSDEVSSTSASGITEGTFISSPRDGRTYNGSVASRFEGLVAAANPQTTGITLLAAVRSPSGGERCIGVSVVDKDDADQWLKVDYTNDSLVRGDYRNGGSSLGGSNWPNAQWNGTLDTNIHVVVIRCTVSGSEMLIDTFIDGALYESDVESIIGNIDMDRLSVGRLEDSSPGNSTGGQVFAAASWDRPLTDSEVRAVSSDPYSYPTDPPDPDDWEEGTVGTEWEDVAFYWEPNHGDRGKNRLYGGAISNSDLSEGTEVTVSSRDGRQYDGAQGSRFNIIPLNVADRFVNWPVSHTLMVVLARPTTSSDSSAFWLGDQTINDIYSELGWAESELGFTESHTGNTRSGGGTPGATGWMVAGIAGTDADTDLHVLVIRVDIDGASSALDFYRDALGTTDSDAQSMTAEAGRRLGRFTTGRRDDSTPANSTDMQVFAAAYWERLLSDTEISAVLADPYGFPGVASSGDDTGGWGFIPI